jgi:hypothetical protein
VKHPVYVREEVEEEKGKIMYQITCDITKVCEPQWIPILLDFRVTRRCYFFILSTTIATELSCHYAN